MANRVLKNADYSDLLVLIFQYSNYKKENADIICKFASDLLAKSGFNTIYIEKLAIDLNLVDADDDGDNIIRLKSIKLEKYFNRHDAIMIKSGIWDILHRGYYE